LGYVQYDAADLLENIRNQSEQALQEGRITLQEAQLLLKNYEQSLSSYTYLKS
jgi:arginine decarboxylase